MIDKYFRGATYELKVNIKVNNKEVLDNSLVDTIQFIFNDINKFYPQDSVYDEENQCYVVYLTQQDTLSFDKPIKQQCRIKFKTGDVASSEIITSNLYPTLSEKIL